MVEAAGERALADEGVHQFESAGAEFLLVLVAALQEVEPCAALAHRPPDWGTFATPARDAREPSFRQQRNPDEPVLAEQLAKRLENRPEQHVVGPEDERLKAIGDVRQAHPQPAPAGYSKNDQAATRRLSASRTMSITGNPRPPLWLSQVNTHSAEKNGFGVSAWLNSPRHSSSNASRGLKPCRTCAVYRMGWPLGQAPGYFDLLVMRPIRRFA